MIFKHATPPQKNLKAHYFDRYANNIEGSKLLSSVGDQSRPVQVGRCYETNAGAGNVTCNFPNSSLITRRLGEGMTLSFWATYPSFGGSVRTEQGNFSFERVTNDINHLIQFGYSGNNGGASFSMQWQTRDEANNIYRLRMTDSITPKNQMNLWVFRMINNNNGTVKKEIWVDNILKVQETVTEPIEGNNSHNSLMHWEKAVGLGSTKLADIRYFRTAISEDDMLNLFNHKPIAAKPILWYKCDEGTGTTSYDSSGNGLHASISNATLSAFHSTQNSFNFQNETGYSVAGNGALIPAKNDTHDVLDNELDYKGQVSYPALLKQSNCINLDGVDDHILLDQDIVIDRTKKYEISFRIFNTSNNTSLRYLFRGGDAYSMFNYIRYRSGKLYPYTTGTGYIQGAIDFYNKDVEIKFIFDPITNKLSQYIDGIFDGEGLVNDNTLYNAISRFSHAASGVEGKIYNIQVKENDILIHHYPVAEGGGTTVYDIIGGNHGSLVNTSRTTIWDKQDVYHYNLENGYSKNLSPILDTRLNEYNWILHHPSWSFENNTATHTNADTTSPRYIRIKPEISNMVAGVTYLAEMDVISTTGTVGFATSGGISTSGGRRNTSGKISHEFIADGDDIQVFAIGTVDCVISNVKLTIVGLIPASSTNEILTNPAGRHHNGAETQIDFSGGIINQFSKNLPTDYKFGDQSFTLKDNSSDKKEKNFLIYNNIENQSRIDNYLKK